MEEVFDVMLDRYSFISFFPFFCLSFSFSTETNKRPSSKWTTLEKGRDTVQGKT